MKKRIDATKGPLVKQILSYAIPLILTTVVQHLFELVDKAVLGNMADTTAVASVGATGTINNLILNCFVGLASGVAIVLARFVGKRDEKKIRSTIDTALISSIVFGVIVAVVGVLLTPTLLRATDCPKECFDGAVLYLRLTFISAPIRLLYNYGSAVLRTLGDTKRPLIYIIIAGAVNAVLNVLLCLVLSQKVAAVALATLASNLIGAVLVLNRLCHFEDKMARVNLRRMRFSFADLGRIFRFGIPSSISNLAIPVANLQIVSAINSFGVDAVAGQSAAVSVGSFCTACTGGFATATTTFMGQNIGAEMKDRVKKSFWYCLGLNVLISGLAGVFLYLSGELWLGLVLGKGATVAIAYGMSRMFHVTLFTFISAMTNVFSHALQAYGYPIFGSISHIVFTLVFRIIWMKLIYPFNPTYDMIMLCFTVSWVMNMLFFLVIITIVYRRYNRGIYKKI